MCSSKAGTCASFITSLLDVMVRDLMLICQLVHGCDKSRSAKGKVLCCSRHCFVRMSCCHQPWAAHMRTHPGRLCRPLGLRAARLGRERASRNTTVWKKSETRLMATGSNHDSLPGLPCLSKKSPFRRTVPFGKFRARNLKTICNGIGQARFQSQDLQP